MKRSIAKGTPEQLLNLVQNRIAELGGDIEACDKITSAYENNDNSDVTDSNVSGWWDKYYDLVDATKCAELFGCDVEDLENFDAYDCTIHGYLILKDSPYADVLSDSGYDGLPLVTEGGDTFPGIGSHGRLFDVSEEIQEIVSNVEACDKITSSAEDDPTHNDRFIHNMIGDIEDKVGSEVDGLTFDTLENALSITVVKDGQVTQFTVPHADLSFDFDKMSDDVAYVVDTIRESLNSFSSADNVAGSSTGLNITSATNTCGIACKPEVLSSVNGDVIHGLTWSGLIQELSERGYEVDAAYRRSPENRIVAYKDGKSYDIEVTRYYEGDYEIHPDNISEVIEADEEYDVYGDSSQSIKASSDSNISDFEITKDGELTRYNGPGGDVIIPDGVTIIGEDAFRNCRSLTGVIIPDGVKRIGESAFASCPSLTDVEIPDSVTSIGKYAFYDCTGLRSIKITNGVISINKGTFEDCRSLTRVVIPNGVTNIDYAAFRGCKGLTSIVIPDSVTSIGEDAFAKCFSLTSITIPESVTSIGEGAFTSCRSLTSVKIPSGVTSIGDWTFAGCTNLTTVEIPDSVTSIDFNSFKGCDKLSKDVKKFISKFYSYDEDEYDNEMSFEEWYDSSQGEDEGMEFVDKLERLVRANYNVDEFFEEPSVQRYQGGDFIWITLSDGSRYKFVFDWYDEQSAIYMDGPEAAAKSYFQTIQHGIDSGSALEDDGEEDYE